MSSSKNKSDFITAADMPESLLKQIESFKNTHGEEEEIGHVITSKDGVASICGLENAIMEEILVFENDSMGMVFNICSDYVDVVMLTGVDKVKAGDIARRTKEIVSVPVGFEMLGRVVDPLGSPIDGLGSIDCLEKLKVEREAPGVIDRQPVTESLCTGCQAIDSLIPIGRGQRELVIGDRRTGKTSVALDIIISQQKYNAIRQKKEKIYCIYVAIGQKKSSIVRIRDLLRKYDALEYTTIVLASASDPASLQYLAPYSGCSMGEFFRDAGMHCVIIYDDLSKHAVAYREMSLLVRNPPGREAYPGDIFYLHSRLLERAAKMNDDLGAGSLTAIPIIETQSDDVSSYIPTNVISITDGQIFLKPLLFNSGIRPAISIGLSVSRVGSSAQIKAMKKLSGSIKLELAQYRELEEFSRLGSTLDDSTEKIIKKGQKLVEFFKQNQHEVLTIPEQVVLLFANYNGFIEQIPTDMILSYKNFLITFFRSKRADILSSISDDIDEKISTEIKKTIEHAMDEFNILNKIQPVKQEGSKDDDTYEEDADDREDSSVEGGE